MSLKLKQSVDSRRQMRVWLEGIWWHHIEGCLGSSRSSKHEWSDILNTKLASVLKDIKAKKRSNYAIETRNTELWLLVSNLILRQEATEVDSSVNLLIHNLSSSCSEVVSGSNEPTTESSQVNPDVDSYFETKADTEAVFFNSAKIWVSTLNRRIL